ncbi:MAG: PQQ-dependent sugar dehydrogenase, partial [Bacteroidetes bacterium]|nr:PQQ-dependent sugar dehydrogenase [Bacteroidota bacterium]
IIRITLSSFFLITGFFFFFYSQTNDLFIDILISDKLGDVVGLTFDHRGRMYAWKKSGVVILLENNELIPDPLIDISEEVTTYGDHGLLGFALHPDFSNNGYFYLLYVVDRHHLLHYGTPSYSPDKTITHEATIGRITRYTADINNDFRTIIPNSRKVILGQDKTNGIPLLHISHGVGSLAFANDGTLLVSVGDGATFASTDLGGFSSETYNFQALADSILKPKEDIGAFRAQLIDCLNGKILRIDPETGLGLPSNPFFDSTAPDAPRSKVWVLGLRNPYRIRVKPQSGSHNPADGDPGVIFIGDVGWAYWEELNIADGAAINFGWPLYEGMKSRWQYFWEKVENKDAANPRYTIDHGCEQPFFYFKDLLLPATKAHNPFFPNPCMNTTSIPSHIPAFVHRRPVLTWSNASWNTEEQGTHIPGFDSSGKGIFYDISVSNSPVKSDTFTGYCSISGVFYSGTKFPASYRNQFLGADMSGWIRKMRFDSSYQLETISPLTTQASRIIHLEMNPMDECLYYVTYHPHFEVRKICYGGNLPPIAKVNTSVKYGTSPLTVDFDASGSYDPEGRKIDFLWNFGDGDTSSLPAPSHEFTAPDENPFSFTVQLIITDSAGASDTEELIISLNNTPPTVKITSVEDGDHYPVSGSTLLPLEADVSDVESNPGEMNYKWEVFHHHNTHVHPEPADFKS